MNTQEADSYFTQGKTLAKQEKFKAAIELFQKAELTIEKSRLTLVYTEICEAMQNLGLHQEAKQYYLKKLFLEEQNIPNTLGLALTYTNYGKCLSNLGENEQSLSFHEKSIKIHEKLSQNSQTICSPYMGYAKLLNQLNKKQEALPYCEESVKIRMKELQPSHPYTISDAEFTTQLCYDMKSYEKCIKYADILLEKDPNSKHGHYYKGCSLEQGKRYSEAVECFEKALEIDPNYAEANLKNIETLQEMVISSENNENSNILYDRLKKGLETANFIKESDYKEKKIQEYTENLKKIGERDINRDLLYVPNDGLSVIDKAYKEKLMDLENKMEELSKTNAFLQEKLKEHEEILDEIVNKMNILEEKVIHHDDIIKIVEKDALAKKGLQEKLEIINKNVDLNDYFHSFLTELQANYIAGLALKSGHLRIKQKDKYKKAADYIAVIVTIIPFIGNLAKELISKGGEILGCYANAKKRIALENLTEITNTQQEFDIISLRIAVFYTLRNKDYLVLLKEKKVLKKKIIKIFSEIVTEDCLDAAYHYMKKIDTEAKLKGRIDAISVISYLQNENVCEEIRKMVISKEEKEKDNEYQIKVEWIVREVMKLKGEKSINKFVVKNKTNCCEIF